MAVTRRPSDRMFYANLAYFSGFAIGLDRSYVAFRGFLPRKTTPRDLYGATVIAKPLQRLCPHEAVKVIALVHKCGSEYRWSNSDINLSVTYPHSTSLGRSSCNVFSQ